MSQELPSPSAHTATFAHNHTESSPTLQKCHPERSDLRILQVTKSKDLRSPLSLPFNLKSPRTSSLAFPTPHSDPPMPDSPAQSAISFSHETIPSTVSLER